MSEGTEMPKAIILIAGDVICVKCSSCGAETFTARRGYCGGLVGHCQPCGKALSQPYLTDIPHVFNMTDMPNVVRLSDKIFEFSDAIV